jgi:internalin A
VARVAGKNRELGTSGGGDGRNKSPEKIAEERIEAAWKSQATELDLSRLGLTELPASVGYLTQLRVLNIAHNKLTSLSAVVDWPESSSRRHKFFRKPVKGRLPLEIVSKGRFDKSEPTIVGGEDLDVPTYIRRGVALADPPREQSPLPSGPLAGNEQVTTGKEVLGRLLHLRKLDASENRLSVLPAVLGDLSRLQTLDLSYNRLSIMPESLRRLKELQSLFLHGNLGLGLPPEVLGANAKEVLEEQARSANPINILDYYFTARPTAATMFKRTAGPLNEAKMVLVGRGGVGKTCLVNRLVHGTYYLVSGIDYTFGQEEGCNEDCIQADVG